MSKRKKEGFTVSDLERLRASNRAMLETRQQLLNWPTPVLPASGAFPRTWDFVDFVERPPLGPPPSWAVQRGTQSDPLPTGRFRNLDLS